MKKSAQLRRSMGEINVAIIGVGNCASSLVQGVQYYRKAKREEFVPGLMHVDLGGYHVGDIRFVAAFDIDKNKVGKDLAQAIFATPNNTIRFSDVPDTGVKVERGMTHDGLGKYLSQVISKAPGATSNIVQLLKDTGTHVVVNFLPVGSEMATKWYIEQVLDAGCGFVNCIPVFIAREQYWQKRFEERGLPVIGDDIKSQVGATITHRVLTHLFRQRGVKLEVWDSPNSAGVVIDAIRCCKLAMDRGLKGALIGPSAYFMKSPPVRYTDDEAHRLVEDFIAGKV